MPEPAFARWADAPRPVEEARPQLAESFRKASRLCAAATLAMGALVLTGWLFDVRAFMQVVPGAVAMVPNTAVAFLLVGLSLWLQAGKGADSSPRLSRVAAGAAGLLGLLELAQYVSGTDLGIDQLLFRDPEGLTSVFPGRMAVVTALGFMAIAGALLTSGLHRARWFTDALALVPGLLGLLSLAGYAYGVRSLTWIGTYKGMAVHTALAFILLTFGTLFARPDRPISGLLLSESLGGHMVRRVLPFAVGIPVVLGWLEWQGRRADVYQGEFGVALLVVASIVFIGGVIGWQGAALERIDRERFEATREVRLQRETLQSILDNMSEAVLVADTNANFLVFNPAAERILGARSEGEKPEEWVQRVGLFRPDGKTLFPVSELPLRRAIQGHSTDDVEVLIRNPNVPRGVLVHSSGRPLRDERGAIRGGIVVFRDMTERREAVERLRKLSHAVEQSPVSVVITDTHGNIEYVNPKFTQVTGYSSDEVLGLTPRILRSGEVPPEVYRELWTTITAGREWRGEFHNRKKDGELFWEFASISPILDEQGRITHFVAVKEDITERKKAEETLAGREHRFRSLIENAQDIITIIDIEGTIRFQSPAAKRILGRAPEEFVGKSAFDFLHPDDAPGVQAAMRRIIESPEVPQTSLFRFRHANGSFRTMEGIGKVLPGGGSPQIVVNSRDVTDSRALEEQLRQAQKMEAVGRLAGGIAHDFNNLLTAIMGYAELATGRLRPEDPSRLELSEIEKAAQRAADLTRQLLAFSRKQVLQPRVISLNRIVSDTDKMLRRLIGEDIELVTLLNDRLGSVKADTGQIEQVLLNLAVNARDAMPKGGKLTIETSEVALDESYSVFHFDVPPGRYVLLAVSDTGTGMDAKTLSHVFEPFFTTKEAGKGTGLGLSTVYGVVKQSGGHVTVYSEPGVGTTFKIYLPRVEGLPEEARRPPRQARQAAATETVLVVEDEEAVRRLVCRSLEAHGYKTLPSARASEALLVCEEHAGEIHLMLTDVVMPNLSGRELAQRAAAFRPRMKVLFMSGYTDDAIVRHGVLDAGTPFLQKPFTPSALASKVREVLDAPERRTAV